MRSTAATAPAAGGFGPRFVVEWDERADLVLRVLVVGLSREEGLRIFEGLEESG